MAKSNELKFELVKLLFSGVSWSYYKEGIEAIEYCWGKCIELKGDNVEKLKLFLQFWDPLGPWGPHMSCN